MDQVGYALAGGVATYSAKSALFTAGYADQGTFFDSTGSFTITLSTTSLSAGWSAWFRCLSGTQTFDPSGSVTINGATTYAVSNAGDVVLVVFDGTNFVIAHVQIPSSFGDVTFADGKNLAFNTSTGTKIGTATGQKMGFWNVTPIIQPAGAGQAAAAAQGQQTLTDSTGGAVSTTLAAITAGAAYAQADMTAVKNAIASIAAQLALIKTDVTNVKTLDDAIRTALVNSGMIKGAA